MANTRLSLFCLAAAMAVAVLVANRASAETISYSLTGDLTALQTSTGRQTDCIDSYCQYLPYVDDRLALTNTATGQDELPGVTLSAGDTIQGTVSLTGSLTVPASEFDTLLQVELQDTPANAVISYGPTSVSYYDKGVQVTPSGLWSNFAGGGYDTPLPVGQASYPAETRAPDFTFDEIYFSADIYAIDSSNGQSLTSATLTPSAPALFIQANEPAPVPLPGTAGLMLFGIAAIGLFARRREDCRPATQVLTPV